MINPIEKNPPLSMLEADIIGWVKANLTVHPANLKLAHEINGYFLGLEALEKINAKKQIEELAEKLGMTINVAPWLQPEEWMLINKEGDIYHSKGDGSQ